LDALVLIVFLVVYAGMFLGEVPGLALDRAGVALLGAIALVAGGAIQPGEAWQAIDPATMGLLLGLMIVSAQFRMGGFYTRFTAWLAGLEVSPATLLGLVSVAAATLSAVLANDIVCLAMAPVLIEGCARRRLNPLPFLLALACASNIGSAATLIGNPQNMLIGQVLGLSFSGYFLQAAVPTVLALGVSWLVILRSARRRWDAELSIPRVEPVRFDVWQTSKGAVVALALLTGFLVTSWPREALALAAAGLLLTSRRMASRRFLGLVDWNLLVLFAGLFVVNHSLRHSGMLQYLLDRCRDLGADPANPALLFATTAVLSNLVSNVPATMLLLPAATHPLGGTILALASTLAGNMLIVGSIANIIVVDQAARLGVRIGWKEHARIGVPVTVLTLLIAALWLLLIA
jgi:Na+/H+ antiporter NhaD/arsenite permease-like protein